MLLDVVDNDIMNDVESVSVIFSDSNQDTAPVSNDVMCDLYSSSIAQKIQSYFSLYRSFFSFYW